MDYLQTGTNTHPYTNKCRLSIIDFPNGPVVLRDLDTTEDAFLTLQTTAFELSNGWHAEFTETPEWNNVKALISCHSRAGRDEDGGIKLGL